MLGHMVSQGSPDEWCDLLTSYIHNWKPYPIKVEHLPFPDLSSGILVYPHELLDSVTDYVAWLTAKGHAHRFEDETGDLLWLIKTEMKKRGCSDKRR